MHSSIKEWHLQTLLCSVSQADHLLQSPHSVADLTLICHYYFHSLQFQQHPHFQGPPNDHHPVQKYPSAFDLLSDLYWSCSQTSVVQYQNLTQRSNYSLGLIALQAGWCSMHLCTGNLKMSKTFLLNPLIDKKLPLYQTSSMPLNMLSHRWYCVPFISQVINNSSKLELSLTQQDYSLGVDSIACTWIQS